MSDIRVRRQNHSCEHCRRSKKACDGFILNSGHLSPESSRARSGDKTDIIPCSYCTKTRKRCPLNPNWGRLHPLPPETASSQSSATSEAFSKRKKTSSNHGSMPSSYTTSSHDLGSATILHLLETPSPNNHALSWDAPFPRMEDPATLFQDIPLDECLNFALETPDSTSNSQPSEAISDTLGQTSQQRCSSFDNSTTYSGSQEFDIQALWDFAESCFLPQQSTSGAQTGPQTENNKTRKRTAQRQCDDWAGFSHLLPASPLGINSVVMEASNKHLITESLLRIYHDVLENNLACWLAEDTCPYKMQLKLDCLSPGSAHPRHPDKHAQKSMVPSDWGAAWSNRMYRRVVQLDRVAHSTKMIRLTRAESLAASKALDTAIMAFTTQWSQGRRRSEKCPSNWDAFDSAPTDDLADALNEQFEESFQQSVWEQAKRALQDVAELESYRVVYAELIFGLTQKPWASHDDNIPDLGVPEDQSTSVKDSTLPIILDILAQEGPHVYLERATRKMHALKFRFEATELGFVQQKQPQSRIRRFTNEDRRTIGLLYWLAVMFDTVSSSMNERPVSLADDECQHEDAKESSSNIPTNLSTEQLRHRWDVDHFIQDNPEKPNLVTSWPCSYDEAMQAVARSAPVKILIFRHVSYLQNALRKRETSEQIEAIIKQTTLVYRYWNMTHGSFFRDLVKHYDTVPPRIKSWFFCIAVPWHLASLMLADMLDFIDENGLGTKEASKTRSSARMAARIRKASAIELSDLAWVTTPKVIREAEEATAQLPDYHFAVNEGPLLTEPWTVILIRAFAKASLFHLDAAEEFKQHAGAILGHESEDFQDSLRRAEWCTRALWCLGRKSEMARNISKVMTKAMYSIRGPVQ